MQTQDQAVAEPVIYDPGEVRVRGEALHPILWQGRQWAVTTYGVECREGTYAIAKDRLWEREGYPWEEHMQEKEWVDLADFVTAIGWARGWFGQPAKERFSDE